MEHESSGDIMDNEVTTDNDDSSCSDIQSSKMPLYKKEVTPKRQKKKHFMKAKMNFYIKQFVLWKKLQKCVLQ